MSENLSDGRADTAILDGREAVAALGDALQAAWNEFVDDTGNMPDCFTRQGGLTFADFPVGNFVAMANGWLNRKGFVVMPAGPLAELASEITRQDTIHPAGYPATRDGIRLGIATVLDEHTEALDAWNDERHGADKTTWATWAQTRAELLQVAAVAMRTVREITP